MKKMLREVIAPLVEADGGELYLVSVSKRELKIHLAGGLSGSPGTSLVTDRIIGPAVKAISSKTKLSLSSGWTIPAGAERIEPA